MPSKKVLGVRRPHRAKKYADQIGVGSERRRQHERNDDKGVRD